MSKQIINSNQAPAAIGPYSRAVLAGHFLFCSGQIPLDPATGKLVEGDITVQVRRVMENHRAILKAAFLDFADVVKTTIFVKDLNDFALINKTYGEYFTSNPPSRSTVQVAKLPLDAAVEIELIAYAEPK